MSSLMSRRWHKTAVQTGIRDFVILPKNARPRSYDTAFNKHS